MKATGIVRRVDELGRLVIPKEIRRTMRLAEGTPLEIFTDREGQIILKKYSPMMELGSFAKQYAESVAQTMNQKVAVSDRDQIIAVAGGGKRELLGKTISRQLEEMIINRENSIQAGLDKKTIPLISGDEDSYSAQAIYPICCEVLSFYIAAKIRLILARQNIKQLPAQLPSWESKWRGEAP